MPKFLALAIVGAALGAVSCAKDETQARTEPDAGVDASATSDGGKHEPKDASSEGSHNWPWAEAGSDAAEAEAAAPEASTPPGYYPPLLSQAGLYADLKKGTLAPGVSPFEPKYVLWSDGATKQRWLYLPPGATIDTSDMNYWKYPVGTKVFKEFTRDGVRVETRMIHKAGPDPSWVLIAYQWRSDLSDAEPVPDGVDNANGTQHDIPSQSACQNCHGNMPDRLLGVTAIQLSHSLPGVTLKTLVDGQRLTVPPSSSAGFTIPGSIEAEQALGYLHANCGHCHNKKSGVYVSAHLELWERTDALDTVENTRGYATTVLQDNSVLQQFHIIEPGRPAASELFLRISTRGGGGIVSQMPPLATEIPDPTGIAKVKAWIDSMPKAPDAGAGDGG